VVLIPEVQPPKVWEYLLFNQRGVILGPGNQAGPGQPGAVPPALPAGAVRPHPSEGAAPPVTN
jgi:hypothetical protein